MVVIEVRPVRLAVAEDNVGMLVFKDGALVAILSQLGSHHEGHAGTWYVEAAFNPHLHGSNRTFKDLNEACACFECLAA